MTDKETPQADQKTVKFTDLGLSPRVLKAISDKGFEEPSPIQAKSIPILLNTKSDIIAQAQTGTGKTAAFGLPLIEMIDEKAKHVSALILAPTRELAIQVAEEINSLKGASKLQVVPIYGGQSMDSQLRRLKRGVNIVVGTPGRVVDHIKRKTLKLDQLEYLVLDEADEMLNMGFIDDIELVIKMANDDKRTILFSATMPAPIKKLATKYMKEIESISIAKKTLSNALVNQIYYEVKRHDRFESLCRIVDVEEDFYGLVFCQTKREVDEVALHLGERGYDSGSIHGDITQSQRERILKKFKAKKINILVATDVAARGIDVNDLTHVINYALPQDPESYVHRIGRTGRAGKEGTAITFITPSEYRKLMQIQRISKGEIKKEKLPSGSEIIKIKKEKIHQEIVETDIEKVDEMYKSWAKELTKNTDPVDALAQVLSYSFEPDLDPELYKEFSAPSSRSYNDRDDRGRGGDRGGRGGRDSGGMDGKTRLFVAKGKMDGMNPRKVVDYIMQNAGVESRAIDDVQVLDKFSFITVPFDQAETILDVFNRDLRGARPIVVKAKPRR